MITTMRLALFPAVAVLTLSFAASLPAEDANPASEAAKSNAAIDRDLLEVSVPQLEQYYREHRFTVTQVVNWYIARIREYNGVYGAIEKLDAEGALADAAHKDAEPNQSQRGPMWGVPIVIKENTSAAGLVTTDGWEGFVIPGKELVAPKDATIVARLRAAGAIILAKTNMPDFAASDTNRSSSYGRTSNAYDVRFSPGGSSGGTVTAVTANFAMLGNGTDTGNSIRMPAATSSVVGVFPTRGLVSIAGIAPLDWQLDNTGPIARNVTDAAIALSVMAGEDPLDERTLGSAKLAEPGPYTNYLHADALKGKRFGVPAFILHGAGVPFQGGSPAENPREAAAERNKARLPLRPETREAFMRSVEELRAAGATVVFDDAILPDSFAETVSHVYTLPYLREGAEKFLAGFGPALYHSADEYEKAVGSPIPPVMIGGGKSEHGEAVAQAPFTNNPQAERDVLSPRQEALDVYDETLDRFHLDGYIYPAIQMPPPDETMPQDGQISSGPHSDTSWVNMIGVPAVVVPAGFYPSGLPVGLEISARRWKDGDLLGWAYAFEQATHLRKPPVLVEKGLLSIHPRP